MLTKAKTTIAGLSAAAMLAVSSMAAVPVAQAASPGLYNGAPIVLARHQDDRKWKRHNRQSHRHHRGNNFPAGIFGFATGAILGSMLAQPHYRGSNWDAYCSSKYKTYKPRTGTYTGFDGREHYCR